MALSEGLFPGGLEPLLAAMAQRFAAAWAEREVELCASAQAALLPLRTDPRRGELYCLSLQVPEAHYLRAARSEATRRALEASLLSCARGHLPPALRDKLESVSLAPLLSAEPGWRERLRERRLGAPRKEAPPPPPAVPRRHGVEVQVRPAAAVPPKEERRPKDLRELEAEWKEERAAKKARYRTFRIP